MDLNTGLNGDLPEALIPRRDIFLTLQTLSGRHIRIVVPTKEADPMVEASALLAASPRSPIPLPLVLGG